MALAVKNAPEVASASLFDRLGVVSLVGLVYVLGSLGIVLGLLPKLWFDGLHFSRDSLPLGAVLGCLMLVVAAGLIYLGGRLLGNQAPAGARAGIFVAFVGFLMIVLLTRWASLWIEHAVYRHYWFGSGGPMFGAILTGLVGLGLLIGGLRWLFSKNGEKTLVGFESQGWFTNASYKSQQGQRVRRGTILGVLIIAVAGIWTLIGHGTLKKGTTDWVLNVPFTAKVAIESEGDLGPALDTIDKNRPKEPAYYVRLKSAGDSEKLKDQLGEYAPRSEFDAEVARLTLEKKKPPVETGDRLELDRYQLRDLNGNYANPEKYVKVTEANRADNLRGKEGEVISKADFDAEVAALTKEFEEENRNLGEDARAQLWEEFRKNKLPQKVDPTPATGTTRFAGHLPVLRSVQYTIPVLLLVAALWLAWRMVNLPAFADFLIATEAELNKVSWTTRKRLFQDTVVVLITVVLMAGFLFTMDLVWKELLSLEPVGVLHLPKGQAEQNKDIEQKPW